MAKGKLFIISGASGVGKSTVLKQVMAKRTDLQFSVSATTRPPRPTETHGVNYYFVSREEFSKMVDQGEFLEHSDHMGNLYGTPRQQVEENMQHGHVILDIEPHGAFCVRQLRPDSVLIFVAPPSLEELEFRLRNRGDTSPEQIAMRLSRARWEMDQLQRYDYVVVNDTVAHCAEQILNIIAKEAD